MIEKDRLQEFVVTRRRLSGMTQEELADRSGVSVRTIRNLETKSVAYPRPTTLRLILEALSPARGGSVSRTFDYGYGYALRLPRGAIGFGEAAWDPGAWLGERPHQGTTVGREREIEWVIDSIADWRLVSLVGPGGVGKSRLALLAADRALHLFPGGVAVVDAVGLLAGAEGVVDELRAAVYPQLERLGQAREQQSLLVLDGVEHMANAVSRLSVEMQHTYPRTHLLLTSRRHLPLLCARSLEIQPFEAQAPRRHGTARSAAVELFERLAATECPSLDLSEHADSIALLCHRLGGLPFAIELAVNRCRSLPLEALLRHGPGLQLLGEAPAARHVHQLSLATSLDWSLRLLSPGERDLLARLALLPEEFTIDQVSLLDQAPDRLGPASAIGAMGLLAALVDASMVRLLRGHQYTYRLQPFVREHLNVIRWREDRSDRAAVC